MEDLEETVRIAKLYSKFTEGRLIADLNLPELPNATLSSSLAMALLTKAYIPDMLQLPDAILKGLECDRKYLEAVQKFYEWRLEERRIRYTASRLKRAAA